MDLGEVVHRVEKNQKTMPSSVIVVHLPFQQYSKISLQSGCTVREKVGKILNNRMVAVDACSLREKRKSGEEINVNWNDDLSKLHDDSELLVHLSEPHLFRQHNLEKARFSLFSPLCCKFCSKRIFRGGFRCKMCELTFHHKCGSKYIMPFCHSRKINGDKLLKMMEPCPSSSCPFVGDTSTPCFVDVPKPKYRESSYSNNKLKVKSFTKTPVVSQASIASQSSTSSQISTSSLYNWKIDAKRVKKNFRIGEGTFSYVYKGDCCGAVALKVVRRSSENESSEALRNEIEILMSLRHANILMFKGWFQEPRLGIVIQWCDNLSLFKHLHVNEPVTKFSADETINISKQIAQGMEYLHLKNVLHRDLKSNNIFLTDDFTVKIGDFGLSKFVSQYDSQKKVPLTGSILWMAPEVIRNDEVNFSSDVYSYGVVLYEIASGTLPYSDVTSMDQILFMVGKGWLKPDLSKCRSDLPKRFRNLLQKCIQFDKSARPSFTKVLNDLTNLCCPKMERSVSVVMSSSPTTDLNVVVPHMKKESVPCPTQLVVQHHRKLR